MMMTKMLRAFGLLVITAAVTCMAPAQAQTTVRYLHTDALGTVVAKTDANGNVVERTTFEPYGAVVGGAVADGPGYTGHVSDAATGLSYMQQRYYDAEVGLFLSTDPVTAHGGDMRHFNVYAYAYNNPYKFTDPDGRCPMACPGDIQPTIEYSATIMGWAADGLEAVDQFMTALGPQGSGFSKLSVAPLARMARPLAVEAKAAAQLAKNAAQGAKAEAKVAAEMGAEVAGKRVTLEASTGQRSVADIVTSHKGVVEVKSGGAKLSSGQKAIKADVEAGRPVTPRGRNALDAGLQPNVPTQMKCYDVKRCQ
ncbi:RHS repeat domain-containing protein [Stenotrophomonas sp. NPDC078853]|uniref:RHS repeat domain-containing protein n=1 Tax=Stenotrophomonas sp. NPDC078853 TaxID=3364534 RepID=UPI003850E05D